MLLLEGHATAVYALAFSPDGRFLASGGRDGSVWLWDGSHERRELRPGNEGTHGPTNGLDFTPDGTGLIYATAQGWAGLRVRLDGPFELFGPPRGDGTTAVRHLTPHLIAVGYGSRSKTEAGRFELWDTLAGKRREPRFTAPHGVRSVAVHPPTKVAAWSEWGGMAHHGPRVTVWDIAKSDPLRFNLSHTAPAIAFHPDGTLLAAASEWGFKLFDLTTKRERAAVRGHKGTVSGVAFSPDGRHLTTGSWDGTVKVWDAATGTVRASFQWPVGKVFAVAYSPDGLRLAAAGDRGTIVLWDTE
jgi:WD40 repeat protein